MLVDFVSFVNINLCFWRSFALYKDNKQRLRLDRSTARYIYRENKIYLVDLSIHAQKEKCNFNYSSNTLFHKDLFLTIINFYNQDFVKSAIFQRKVLFSERLFVLQNKVYYKSCR
jgi:hypothetical protein